ncbi:MAG: ABC-2 transporter permease [Oscillospiraceae bacterium]|nr:ABC-2 transporter permease [Oscillospiraceae bacterium]
MKGLILNDFFCVKKFLIIYVRIFIVVLIVGSVLLLGTIHGNLKDADPHGELTDMLVGMFDLIIPLIAGLSVYALFEEVFFADKKGWSKYMFCLPVCDYRKVAARYIVATSTIVLSLVMFIGISAAFHSIAGSFTWKALGVPIAFYCVAVVLSYTGSAFLYWLGDKKKMGILTMSVYLIGGGGAVVYARTLEESVREEKLLEILNKIIDFTKDYWYLALIVTVVVIVLSYFVAVYAVKRREKFC